MRSLALSVLALMLALPVAFAGSAPDFALRDTANQEVRLSDYQGKVVLVNFWATWCAPCQVEMPHLDAFYKKYGKDGLVVLAISTDDARSASRVKPLVRSKGYTFTVLLDKETEVVAQYNPRKELPYTVIIDRQGNIVFRHSGYTAGDEIKLEAEIMKLLKAP
jgi:peroxiredoxin